MHFDASDVPFSRYGAYMALNVLPPHWDLPGLTLRTMHGVLASREVFQVRLVREGAELPAEVTATATLLRLEADGARAEFCFAEPDLIRVRGHGAALRLSSIRGHDHYAFPAGGGAWHVNCPANHTQYLLLPLRGGLAMDTVHRPRTQDKRKPRRAVRRPRVIAEFTPDESGEFEGAVHEFLTTARKLDLTPSFDECLGEVEREWHAWLRTTPALPQRYEAAAELAMYVNWTSVVAPSGNILRPTMLMSKNWMTKCWSWDHCFNAMALSYRNPDLAWDQFMAPFDHQDEHGVLPDGLSAPGLTWNFCKPPVHGWALSKLARRRGLLTEKRARQAYRVLRRWTEWWMGPRDGDGDGLAEYHNGNDSGWDNATVFDGGYPVAGADLAAYLVLQMDVLGDLARRLGRQTAAARWRRRADALRKRMLEELWNGEQFVSPRAFTGEVFPEGDSLINFLPIVMGKRLPKVARAKLAEALRPGGRFVTDYGPATESPQSPLYVPDGYWRGPIWGPEAVIIADGLARAGFGGQAREIARRYCDMCVAGGFAENYDATTGEPLRDKAYTWGSSAYLVLAHEFLRG